MELDTVVLGFMLVSLYILTL